jgi:coenzyme Q-binding protein COQ10
MPQHSEQRLFPYPPAAVFDMVADVERYPEFLPWCVGARVLKREAEAFTAEVMVGFKMVRERYVSRVVLSRPGRIDVQYISGPFQKLENRWTFTAVPEGCRVDFHLNFEFRSRMLQRLIGVLFNEAVRRMVAAFEARARHLYGRPASSGTVPDGTAA